MPIEIPIHEVSLKEEGLAHLFRADSSKFGRGIADGSRSSVPFDTPLHEGLLAMAKNAVQHERERFPNVPDLEGRDYEVGVVIGIWIALKGIETEMKENPHFRETIIAQGGLPK